MLCDFLLCSLEFCSRLFFELSSEPAAKDIDYRPGLNIRHEVTRGLAVYAGKSAPRSATYFQSQALGAPGGVGTLDLMGNVGIRLTQRQTTNEASPQTNESCSGKPKGSAGQPKYERGKQVRNMDRLKR